MRQVSKCAQRITPSGIRKMFNRAFGMEDLIMFAVGEPDFTAHPLVVEAANKANLEGNTKYTPNAGVFELREKVAASLRKKGCNYDPETEIVITTGGQESLALVMLALIDSGDEVIVTEPYYPNHIEHIKLAGGIPCFVPVIERDGFVFNLDEVRKAISPKTKMILLNTPSNPCGSVTPIEVQEQLAKIAIENDLFVVSDEVYQYFIYDGLKHNSIATLPGMKERTLIVDSFSKTYAMTGWRVGYTAGPEFIISQMTKLHEETTSSVNSSAQFGAMAALDLPYSEIEKMRNIFDSRRKLLVDGLNSICNISCINPKGAFYAFPNISKTGLTSEEFAYRLLDFNRVVVAPGTAFGEAGEGFVRLAYANSEENIVEGIKRIELFVNSL